MERRNASLVLDVSPTGGVEGMHMDRFDLGFLGDKKIERASEIIFNEKTQKWDIHVNTKDCFSPLRMVEAAGFDTYEGARSVEVRWFNASRFADTPPISVAGLELLRAIRM